LSMSTENLLLALGRNGYVWSIGAVLGWIAIPIMNVNLTALFRSRIPVELQGRVFSARDTLQNCTIPLGLYLGGLMSDRVFEPWMASPGRIQEMLSPVFGTGRGSGISLLFLLTAILGLILSLICLNKRFLRETKNKKDT